MKQVINYDIENLIYDYLKELQLKFEDEEINNEGGLKN